MKKKSLTWRTDWSPLCSFGNWYVILALCVCALLFATLLCLNWLFGHKNLEKQIENYQSFPIRGRLTSKKLVCTIVVSQMTQWNACCHREGQEKQHNTHFQTVSPLKTFIQVVLWSIQDECLFQREVPNTVCFLTFAVIIAR